MKLQVDTHAHTLVSGHAYNTMNEMAQGAYENGLEVLALTEHAPMLPGTCQEIYFQNLNVVPRNIHGVEILLGTELNIMDASGRVDLPGHVLKQLDIVIASVHILCYGESKGMEANTEAYINAMKNPYINIIGHPDDGRIPVDFEKLVLAAKEYHVLLEVNNSSLRPISYRKNADANIREMLTLCKKHQVSITVGSDAHTDMAAGRFTEALQLIKESEFPEELVASTSLEKLNPYINNGLTLRV